MNSDPKFAVGDKVWAAGTTGTKHSKPCPDCLGTEVWETTSPAGTEYTFARPRCSASYMHDRNLSLNYFQYEPNVTRLTIGSVQTNTARQPAVQYMCVETGVGSGQI